MENHVTQIKITLSIFGDSFNPKIFSEYINLTPTNSWVKEDIIPRKKGLTRKDDYYPKRKESAWEFSTGFIQTLYFDEVAEIILNKFDKHKQKVKRYVIEESLEVKMDVIIEIGNKQPPSLGLSSNLVSFLSNLKGEIDINLYVLEDD